MNVFLDVAISMAFIFLLFSIIVSGAIELWQMITRRRAHFLRRSLNDVLNDRLNKNYTHLLYMHPLVDRLKEHSATYPHYIPSSVFADALIDVVRVDGKLPRLKFDHSIGEFAVSIPEFADDKKNMADGTVQAGTGIVEDFNSSVESMQESDLKQVFRTFGMGVKDYQGLKTAIIKWYDDYMGATSTWYKRSMTKMLFIAGFIVAVVFNIDSISLAQDFYKDKLLRDQVVTAAVAYTANESNRPAPSEAINFGEEPAQLPMDSVIKDNIEAISDAYEDVGMLDLPIGWSVEEVVGQKKYPDFTVKSRPQKIFPFLWELLKYIGLSLTGWLITAAALSYGADNWFNLLTRFIGMRSAVKPKDESK
jgi:hypothetical protein